MSLEAIQRELEVFGLQVSHSEEKGRHILAQRDYKSGELVGCFFPLQSAVLDNYKKRVCAHCHRWNDDGRFSLCCDHCEAVYFCSPHCQTCYHTFEHHQDICQYERKLATWKADKDARSLMRLYLKVVVQTAMHEDNVGNVGAKVGGSAEQANGDSTQLEGIKEGQEVEAAAAAAEGVDDRKGGPEPLQGEKRAWRWNPLAADFSFTLQEALEHYGVELDDEWKGMIGDMMEHRFTLSRFSEAVPLQSHVQDWTKEDLRDWHKHTAFLSKTTQAALATLNRTEGALHGHLQEANILPLISAFESNNFGIWSAKGEVLGRSVYPRASYFNHSCDPTCYTERKGPILFIVTEAEVKKGEELTISYIDTNQPRSARQTFLKQHYHFGCMCSKCMAESVAGGKIKVTYAKSKNNTQKSKIPKKKQLWKEKDPLTLSDMIAAVPIYAPVPFVPPTSFAQEEGKDTEHAGGDRDEE